MPGLHHIEIDQGWVCHLVAPIRRIARMERQQAVEGVDLPDVARHLSPAFALLFSILLLGWRQVIGHGGFPRQAPHHRISPIARDQVAPVFLHLIQAHVFQVITPTTEDARDQSRLDQPCDADIRPGKVVRVDARVTLLPWKTGLIGPAGVELVHIRV